MICRKALTSTRMLRAEFWIKERLFSDCRSWANGLAIAAAWPPGNGKIWGKSMVSWGHLQSIHFFPQLWSCMGFSILPRDRLCSIMISWFRLVPAQVPGLVSLLSFLFSGKGFCSNLISWFLLVPARLPGFVSPLFFSFFPQKKRL